MSTDLLRNMFRAQAELNNLGFKKQGIPVTMETLYVEGSSEEDKGPNSLTNEWLNRFTTAQKDEVRELDEELLWKWWSKDKLDMQNIRVEIVDQMHFLISLAITAGMDADSFSNLYEQKVAVNVQRQLSGYSKENKNEDDNKELKV